VSELIVLEVNGTPLNKTWSDVRVKRSMTSVCSSFDFVTVQESPNFNYKDWRIRMGNACRVLIDGKPVLSGYIEDINISYNKDTHTVQVAGRDKTCDLVDCHYMGKGLEGPFAFGVKNAASVKYIVTTICEQFGISVDIDSAAKGTTSQIVAQRVWNKVATAKEAADLKKFSFYVSPGDSVIGTLYRITRWAKVFMLASTDGKLILTMAGSRVADTELKVGVNILKGGLKQSNKEVYSVYRVKGYCTATDNLVKSENWAWMNGVYPKPPKAPAKWPYETSPFIDPQTQATRFRPYGLVSEQAVQTDATNSMAKAEAQFRAGKSISYNYSVQGLHDSATGKTLWEPNTLVHVTDPLFGLDTKVANPSEPFLIETVDYTQTDQGTTTELTLCHKDKYAAEAEINKIKTVLSEGGGNDTR
jgi:prophage tail gpP-like protein